MDTLIGVDVHVVLDANPDDVHFIDQWDAHPFTLHRQHLGSDGDSLRFAIGLAVGWTGTVVFLEDDYRVAPGWIELIAEGLRFSSYVTLYDHPDKYSRLYAGLTSQLFLGSRHWRTVPSTTNSWATSAAVLVEDKDIHCAYGSRDHEKFLALWSRGRRLVSCMPGAWSHEEVAMKTPVT